MAGPHNPASRSIKGNEHHLIKNMKKLGEGGGKNRSKVKPRKGYKKKKRS